MYENPEFEAEVQEILALLDTNPWQPYDPTPPASWLKRDEVFEIVEVII